MIRILFISVAVGSMLMLPSAATTLRETYTASPDLIIPDNDAAGVVSSIDTSATNLGSLDDVSIYVETTGGWNGDLYSHLSHDGRLSVLLNRVGRDQSNYDGSSASGFSVWLTDDATTDIHVANTSVGMFQPDGRLIYPVQSFTDVQRQALLDQMQGSSTTGAWHLFAADLAPGDQASLKTWMLSMQGTATLSSGQDLVINGPHLTEVIGASTHTGMTTVQSGTVIVRESSGLGSTNGLQLNGGLLQLVGPASDKVSDVASVFINGGRLSLATGSEAVGLLSVGPSGGILDFGEGDSVFHLADSSSILWDGSLHVWNWSGNQEGSGLDRLFFGDGSSSGLTIDQISRIQFYSDSGLTLYHNDGRAALLETGELIAVPEPSAALLAGFTLATALLKRKRS